MIYRSFSASGTFSASVFLSSLKKVLILLYLSLSCYVWYLCIFKAWTELIGIVYSLLVNEWVGPKIYIYIYNPTWTNEVQTFVATEKIPTYYFPFLDANLS